MARDLQFALLGVALVFAVALVLPGDCGGRADPCASDAVARGTLTELAGTWSADNRRLVVRGEALHLDGRPLAAELVLPALDGWFGWRWHTDGKEHELQVECQPLDGYYVFAGSASLSLDGPFVWWTRQPG